jgi:hypothetical protein
MKRTRNESAEAGEDPDGVEVDVDDILEFENLAARDLISDDELDEDDEDDDSAPSVEVMYGLAHC